ncbi:amidohydrolase [Shouchella miscanthi]|uniref:amidohydrolase n=1 Tax=Shouchella miscanthi TaxID=2598861 RepID=UPI0011A40694|nr:amidohydrolase [Shouchella miscanthi]
MSNEIDQWVKQKESDIKTWRQEMHKIAEVGFCEYETTYYIFQQLEGLGFTLHTGRAVMNEEARFGVPSEKELAKHEERALANGVPAAFLETMKNGFTGVIAVLETEKEGSHTAMRFDIDALPIEEEIANEHIPAKNGFRSRNDGMMHACGHDGHAAIGLGIATFLSTWRGHLSGTYTLIFQPAEEGSRGAKAVVENGWLNGVNSFLSGHLGIRSQPVGTLVSGATNILATTKIDARFTGKTAHAGMEPHKGKNAMLAAATAVLNLHGISPHGEGETRLNVGRFDAGSGRNIVPGEAFLQLETRGKSTTENAYMKEEAVRRLEGAAHMYDVALEYAIVGEGLAAETDQYFIDKIPNATEKSQFVNEVKDLMPLNGSEDVTYMMRHVQDQGGFACYMIFGTPLAAGHHHKQFDFDEDALLVAVSALAHLIIE